MFSDSEFASWLDRGQAAKSLQAQAALLGAQAQMGHANAAGVNADTTASLAPSEIAWRQANAARVNTENEERKKQMEMMYGYAAGTSSVPGAPTHGVDTVPAMLQPQEAVLNPPAADMLGRGLIDFLNAVGNLKAGMPPAQPAQPGGMPPAPTDKPPGYARGTSSVPPKAAAKGGGSKPQAGKGSGDNGAGAAALMQFLRGMGGGGGQMPMGAPGSAPPQHFASGTSNVQPAWADSNQYDPRLNAVPEMSPRGLAHHSSSLNGQHAMQFVDLPGRARSAGVADTMHMGMTPDPRLGRAGNSLTFYHPEDNPRASIAGYPPPYSGFFQGVTPIGGWPVAYSPIGEPKY